MTTFQSLPPELVDEILWSDELSIEDLVQCCLVSTQFLPSARRSLYNLAKFRVEYDHRQGLWIPNESTAMLLSTIRQDPSLGRLCICLDVEEWDGSFPEDCTIQERLPKEMLDEWFSLLPNLRMLSTPNFSHNRFRPCTLLQLGGHSWNALSSNVCCLAAEFQDFSGGSTLKKLSCGDLAISSPDDGFGFPSSVVTLDLCDWEYDASWHPGPKLTSLCRPQKPHLRNLRICLRRIELVQLEEFPNLEYLSVYRAENRSTNLTKLTGLNGIRRLSIQFHCYHGFRPVKAPLQSLLSALPRSIHRPDFGEDAPHELFSSFLGPGGNATISQLGLGKRYSTGQEKEDVTRLCEARGIDVYWHESRDPIFGGCSLS
jgi:hypothetical protein